MPFKRHKKGVKTMSKKYLKGFANLGYIPVADNTDEKYAVTADGKQKLASAVSCAPTDNRKDFSIAADDGIWDEGSDWTDTTLEIVLVEAELKLIAYLTGAAYTDETTAIEEGALDSAPEVALTFSALRADGGYRLYRYYAAKCTNVKITHNTKGSNNNNDQYTLTIKATPRKFDKHIRGTIDVAKGTALTWLDTIPSMPTTTGA
jgi:phi13 family phage major tail protein